MIGRQLIEAFEDWFGGSAVGRLDRREVARRAKEAAGDADTSEPGSLRRESFDHGGDPLPGRQWPPLR